MKRVFDILVSLVALIVLAPVFVLVSIMVRRKLGSPVFFRQQRPGLNGAPFEMVKFRTMIAAHGADGKALPDSERLTAFGRFLRSTSLDELPELWNVLKGDMSLVGPRPMTPDQALRHPGEACCRLRPGITGVWQVSGRDAPTLADRARCNATYEQNLSLATDLQILAATVRGVLREADHS